MSIPLQASTPLVGIDPLGIQDRKIEVVDDSKPLPTQPTTIPTPPKVNARARPPEMTPGRFRQLMPVLLKLRPDLNRQTLIGVLLHPGRRSHGKRERGNPGAGMFRNAPIHKAHTYRATYVPGGFNVERDKRRADKAESVKQLKDATARAYAKLGELNDFYVNEMGL